MPCSWPHRRAVNLVADERAAVGWYNDVTFQIIMEIV
jgi:hypothetical protein